MAAQEVFRAAMFPTGSVVRFAKRTQLPASQAGANGGFITGIEDLLFDASRISAKPEPGRLATAARIDQKRQHVGRIGEVTLALGFKISAAARVQAGFRFTRKELRI